MSRKAGASEKMKKGWVFLILLKLDIGSMGYFCFTNKSKWKWRFINEIKQKNPGNDFPKLAKAMDNLLTFIKCIQKV